MVEEIERTEVTIDLQTVHVNEIRGRYGETSHTIARPITNTDTLRDIIDLVSRSIQMQGIEGVQRERFLDQLRYMLATQHCVHSNLSIEQTFVVMPEPEPQPRSNNPAHVMAAALRNVGLPVNDLWIQRMADICGRPVSDLPLGWEVEDRPPRGITVNGRHPFGREVETPHRLSNGRAGIGDFHLGDRLDIRNRAGDIIASGIALPRDVPMVDLNQVTVQLLDADGNPVGDPVPGTIGEAPDPDPPAADPNLPPVAMNQNNELAECVFCNKKPARIWAEGFAPECDECASHWETPNDED